MWQPTDTGDFSVGATQKKTIDNAEMGRELQTQEQTAEDHLRENEGGGWVGEDEVCVQREEAQAVAGQVETRSLSYRWGNSKTKWRIIQRCSTICCHTTYDTLLSWPPDGDTYKRMQREDGSESKRHGDTNATGGKAVATEKRKRE